jgi:hypothetical protein
VHDDVEAVVEAMVCERDVHWLWVLTSGAHVRCSQRVRTPGAGSVH